VRRELGIDERQLRADRAERQVFIILDLRLIIRRGTRIDVGFNELWEHENAALALGRIAIERTDEPTGSISPVISRVVGSNDAEVYRWPRHQPPDDATRPARSVIGLSTGAGPRRE
jgi:hypothetical protein